MAENPAQNGTQPVLTDEVSTLAGAAVSPPAQAQRVKVDSKGVDGSFTDVSSANPFPVVTLRSSPGYRLFVPIQAVGANKVFFDLFNAAGSGKSLRILSVIPIVSGAVVVTGTLAVDLFLTRTGTVGTGGTAASKDSSSLTAPSLSLMDPGSAILPAGVTARITPTGGATPGAVISGESLFTEETNASTYQSTLFDFVRRMGANGSPTLIVPEGTGIRIVQGAVASVGNIGFDVIFETV